MSLLTIIDIVFVKEKWLVLTGLYVGTILSMAKFGSYAWVFGKIIGVGTNASDEGGSESRLPERRQSPGSSIIVFTLNQLILLPLLFLAYYLSTRLFVGFVAGILTVPFVILVNSITEALGITKNHFE